MKKSLSPQELLNFLDKFLLRYTITHRQNCALCYLEIEDYALKVVNAGSIPPYIRRANGTIEEVEIGGLPLGLGLAEANNYPVFNTTLAPQDILILVSDGVIEANTKTNDLFGFERLVQSIATAPSNNAQATLNYLNTQLLNFVGATEQHDDLTITVIQMMRNE